jgi:hypothetical protein
VELTLDNLLSGAVGAVLVFVPTTASGAVVRTLQRGRELLGLARVIRPEMERNSDVIGILQCAGLDADTYRNEHPTWDAWRDTRVRLSQLMKVEDFAKLANFYDALEMLDVAINHDPVMAESWLAPAADYQIMAMKVVDGYRDARWRIFKGWMPADF